MKSAIKILFLLSLFGLSSCENPDPDLAYQLLQRKYFTSEILYLDGTNYLVRNASNEVVKVTFNFDPSRQAVIKTEVVIWGAKPALITPIAIEPSQPKVD